ncbi:tRNA (Guanine-N(7)-)-methyltransferase non-catalytic subunit wdr4 [Durusdinium trenchii]
MSKPLALPVVPIVLHPTRSSVVWAVGSRIFAYDLQLKAFEAKAADLETLGPVRALDVWQGEGKLLWLAAGDDKTVTTWLDDGNHGSSWQIHETLSHQKKLTRAIFDRKGRIILADRFGDVCRWT